MNLENNVTAKSSLFNAEKRAVSRLCEALYTRKIDITSGYRTWCMLGFVFCKYGEWGKTMFRSISCHNPQYSKDKCNQQFDYCMKKYDPSKIGVEYFYKRASQALGSDYAEIFNGPSAKAADPEAGNEQQNVSDSNVIVLGVEPVKPLYSKPKNNKLKASSDDDTPASKVIEGVILNEYKLRFNVVTNNPEIFDEAVGEFVKINSIQRNSIVLNLRNMGLPCYNDTVDLLLESDRIPLFDPFREYFNNLPVFTEGRDYIAELAATVKTDNPENFLHFLRKFLVALVACAIDDKVVNHTVLILVGAQGIGKTKWFQRLLAFVLKSYMYSGIIEPSNKDSIIQICRNLLVNLDELENMNKSEIGTIKYVITLPEVKHRTVYHRTDDLFPRRASFVGSVNNMEFLTDMTGNRRFLAFVATEINYNHTVDMDMVYAQCMYLLDSGFEYWLSPAEITQVNEQNLRFKIVSAEEEFILKHYRPRPEEPFIHEVFFSAGELLHEHGTYNPGLSKNITTVSLGKALSNMGFGKVKKKGIQRYRLYAMDLPFELIPGYYNTVD
jgi:hypothetical protein